MEHLTLQAFLNHQWVDIAYITFPGIAQTLDDLVPAETLLLALNDSAKQLINLKERLAARAIPPQILNMPAISFSFIPDQLRRWGLF